MFLTSGGGYPSPPPGLAVFSQIGGSKFKRIEGFLTMPVSFLIGGGVIPVMIGIVKEARSFIYFCVFW